MDSMRHLSTSLPQTNSQQQPQQHHQKSQVQTHSSMQPPELLSDFRAAALHITNLYKAAAASQDKARAAGYQDAIDELLAFLDKENLGLMDGEGWRVRQWATERLVDDTGLSRAAAVMGSDDGEETGREESPVAARKVPGLQASSSEMADESEGRRTAVSEPPQTPLPVPSTYTHTSIAPSADEFTFRSNHAYPSNHDRNGVEAGMELDTAPTTTSSAPSSTESVRIISRPARGRHTNHNRQRAHNNTALSFNLGVGAGSKRKLPYPDFFDISGFNGFEGRDGKDGGGAGKGGKRGRHV